MKIDWYTKAVLTVIAIGVGLLVFNQKPVREVHAGYHDNNARLQLMNRMGKMERNFKRLESDFVKTVKDYRKYKAIQRRLARDVSKSCTQMGSLGYVAGTLVGHTAAHTHKPDRVFGIAKCLYAVRNWANNARQVK